MLPEFVIAAFQVLYILLWISLACLAAGVLYHVYERIRRLRYNRMLHF